MPPQIPPKDRAAIEAEVERLSARSVLEFGPGASTQVFLDAGVYRIVTCEYEDGWYRRAAQQWKGEGRVDVRRFHNDSEASVDGPPLDTFDLALVDSPIGSNRREKLPGQEECSRLNTTLRALEHAPVVLLHDCHRPGEQATLERVKEAGHRVTLLTPGDESEIGKGVARIERC
jgi:hypothetical protein